MSALLRLARDFDAESKTWQDVSDGANSVGAENTAKECRGRSIGLRQAAEMARDMHNRTRQAHDVAAGGVSGG